MNAAGRIVTRSGWLAQTPPAIQALILARCDLLWFGESELISKADDEAGGIFGVVAGGFELHLPRRQAKTTLAHIGGPGFWIGEIATVRGSGRGVAIVARPGTWMLRLARSDLIRATREQPATWPYFLELAARNLLLANNVIDALKRDDPHERLAATLVNLAGDLSVPLTVNVSQTELAALARVGRSVANSALAAFEERGWLRRRYASLDIVDLAALRRFTTGV
jgi:CRP-like cAMP-binding protein